MTGQGSPKFVFSIITAKCVLVILFFAALFLAMGPRRSVAMVQDRDLVQPTNLALKSSTKLLPNASVFRLDSGVESGNGVGFRCGGQISECNR